MMQIHNYFSSYFSTSKKTESNPVSLKDTGLDSNDFIDDISEFIHCLLILKHINACISTVSNILNTTVIAIKYN